MYRISPLSDLYVFIFQHIFEGDYYKGIGEKAWDSKLYIYESFDTYSDDVNQTYQIYMVKNNVYNLNMVMDRIILH